MGEIILAREILYKMGINYLNLAANFFTDCA